MLPASGECVRADDGFGRVGLCDITACRLARRGRVWGNRAGCGD